MESDHSISTDRFQETLNNLLKQANEAILCLKSSFLIEDVVQSIKFAFRELEKH